MLLNKDYSSGDVVCFKLVNGDEIVTKIVTAGQGGWTISRPYTVVPSPQGLGLMQCMFAANLDADVTLSQAHVIMHAPVVDQLQSYYIQTTTGISTPPKSGIII